MYIYIYIYIYIYRRRERRECERKGGCVVSDRLAGKANGERIIFLKNNKKKKEIREEKEQEI